MSRAKLQSFQGNWTGIQKELVEADFAVVIPLIVLMQECISDGLWNKLNDRQHSLLPPSCMLQWEQDWFWTKSSSFLFLLQFL